MLRCLDARNNTINTGCRGGIEKQLPKSRITVKHYRVNIGSGSSTSNSCDHRDAAGSCTLGKSILFCLSSQQRYRVVFVEVLVAVCDAGRRPLVMGKDPFPLSEQNKTISQDDKLDRSSPFHLNRRGRWPAWSWEQRKSNTPIVTTHSDWPICHNPTSELTKQLTE